MTGTYMQQQNSAADAAIALLAETWPACFQVYEQRRRPLAVGIHHLILEKLDGALTPEGLHSALRRYVGNPWYLRAMVAGAARIDFDGTGTVTIEESASAAAKLSDYMSRRGARAPSASPAPPAPTPRPPALRGGSK